MRLPTPPNVQPQRPLAPPKVQPQHPPTTAGYTRLVGRCCHTGVIGGRAA